MQLPEEVVPLVRKFANNCYRYLFRQPANVAELLRWRERYRPRERLSLKNLLKKELSRER